MFGGLEMKGSGGDAKKEETNAAPPAPALEASSAFSFLNAGPAPAPEPAPAASSGFSFLNPAPAESSPAAPAAPAVASSGFSFMSAAAPAAAAAAATEEPAKAEEDAAASGSEAVSSGFSFLASPSPPADAAAAAPEPEETAPPAAASEAASSGFSFLSGPAPAPPPPAEIPEPAPVADLMSAPTTTTSSPTTATTSFSPATTSSSFAPAGAGISFGGATANTSRPKKKKNRAKKIGMGASSAPSPPRSHQSLPAPDAAQPKHTAHNDPPAIQESNSNTRDDALEAARRAEDFMNQKMKEQSAVEREAEATRAKAAEEAQNAPPATAATKGAEAYDDDIMAAAAAAAKEAQAMSQKGVASGARGIMGGLFRRASPNSSSSNLNGAASGSRPAGAQQSRPPQPSSAAIESTATKPSSATSMSSDGGRAAPSPIAPKSTAYQPTAPTATSTKTFAAPPPLPPRPAPKPEPPKPVTPQERLKGMLQTFRQNVEMSMAKVTQLRQQRSRLMEERQRALAQERLATQQRDLTEQQQTAAAEAEDFELADTLGTVLETYEKEQQECLRMLKHIDMAIQELDNQKQVVVDGVLQCFQTISTQLGTFESMEETKEHKSDGTAMRKFSSMTKHLASEHERLQQDLKHLERDEDLVAEERKEVESAISEQSCQFEKDRDEAKEMLAAVEEEVEELRKQLRAKEAEATQLRNDAAGHDDSILQVRVQFSRQLQRVQKKETTIQDHRNEWEAEKSKFSAEKENHEAEVKAHSEALEAHEKLMSSLKEEISLATVLEKIVQQEIGDDKPSEDNGENEEEDGDLLVLQAEVVKCDAAVTEAREILKAATITLNGLEEEMGTLIAKIPELEAVKKAAAAKRDFKTAGKSSKEIKDATARVKECQEELTGEAVERKETAESELTKLEEELAEKRTVSLQKEKESGLASMKKLAARVEHLVETKKQVCGEEYEADRMQGVGAFVLEEQIKSLAAEGKAFGEKYGGWDELVADILPSRSASAALEESAVSAGQPNEIKEKAPSKPQRSKKERFASCRRLMQELTDIEPRINSAVDDEDYDLAAELDETLQKLMAELQDLDLTDEETELALAGDEGDEAEDTEAAAQSTSEDAAELPVAETEDADDAVTSTPSTEEEAPAAVTDEEAVTTTPSTDDDDTPAAEPLEEDVTSTPSTEEVVAEDEAVNITPSADETALDEDEEESTAVTPNPSGESATEDEEESTAVTPSPSGESAAEDEEESAAVTPNPSGDESLEPATSGSKDDEVDEKKDASDIGGADL